MRSAIKARTVALVAATTVMFGAIGAAQAVNSDAELNVVGLLRATDQYNWDTMGWWWKTGPDSYGMESLTRGDLQKGSRGSKEYPFAQGDFMPYSVIEGSLAESWELLQDPLRIEFKIRDGVMWQAIPGVMDARPLVAADIVKNFEVVGNSPNRIGGFWEYVDRWEAPDDRTAIAYLNRFQADWDYQLTWGYYDGIQPPERLALSAEQRADWRTLGGTGPYRLTNFRSGQPLVYERNPDYWDSVDIDGKTHKLPLNSKVIVHNLQDESAAIAALTTGRVDMWQGIRAAVWPQVQRAAPDLQFVENLAASGVQIALRVDRPPFNDVRVRRALNVAIDQNGVRQAALEGKGELLNFPFGANWTGLYTPINELSPAGQELFSHNPERAKELLAEAGYPNGFEFDVMVNSAESVQMDMLPMLQAWYQQIGVKMNIRPMEAGAYNAARRDENRTAAYMYTTSLGTPIAVLRKTFLTGNAWNPAFYSSEEFEKRYQQVLTEMDADKQREQLRDINRWIIEEEVPMVFLPTGVGYTAWWPWVKNYHGETAIGAWKVNHIYSNIWIDQEMKSKMLRRR